MSQALNGPLRDHLCSFWGLDCHTPGFTCRPILLDLTFPGKSFLNFSIFYHLEKLQIFKTTRHQFLFVSQLSQPASLLLCYRPREEASTLPANLLVGSWASEGSCRRHSGHASAVLSPEPVVLTSWAPSLAVSSKPRRLLMACPGCVSVCLTLPRTPPGSAHSLVPKPLWPVWTFACRYPSPGTRKLLGVVCRCMTTHFKTYCVKQ